MRLPFFGRHSSGASSRPPRFAGAAPIAIDFGRRSVRLLQLARGADAYPCVAAAEIPGWVLATGDRLHPGAESGDVTARLHDVVMQCGFTGTTSTLTLPAELFQCDTARLPVMADDELIQSVRFEATDRFGLDPDASILGYTRLGAPIAGQQDVLLMAIPRAVVEASVSPVTAAGLGTVHMEHAAFAALRAIMRQRDAEVADHTEAANFAMVHIEDRVTTLVVVRERVPIMVRPVLGDWAPLNTTIQMSSPARGRPTARGAAPAEGARPDDAIPLDDMEQEGSAAPHHASWRWCGLAEEALRCLRHLERQFEGWWPARIILTGPAACDPQAVSNMESVCAVHAELAVPIRILTNPAPCVHGNPWIATIGSAVSQLGPLNPATPSGRSSDSTARRPAPAPSSGERPIPVAGASA